jgi:CrcB protein
VKPSSIKDAMYVAVGGGAGAVIRELLMLGVANLPGGFPLSIFIANVVASALIGIFTALTVSGGPLGRTGKLLLTTGVMGGMSTFSSLIWGTQQMLMNPAERTTGVVYLVLSMVVGFLLVKLGMQVGSLLHASPPSRGNPRA